MFLVKRWYKLFFTRKDRDVFQTRDTRVCFVLSKSCVFGSSYTTTTWGICSTIISYEWVSDYHLTQKNEQFSATCIPLQGRIQDYKLGGGAHLKKLRRAEEARKFLGYFVWKITILRQKIIFFPILGGARAGCAPPLDC